FLLLCFAEWQPFSEPDLSPVLGLAVLRGCRWRTVGDGCSQVEREGMSSDRVVDIECGYRRSLRRQHPQSNDDLISRVVGGSCRDDITRGRLEGTERRIRRRVFIQAHDAALAVRTHDEGIHEFDASLTDLDADGIDMYGGA